MSASYFLNYTSYSKTRIVPIKTYKSLEHIKAKIAVNTESSTEQFAVFIRSLWLVVLVEIIIPFVMLTFDPSLKSQPPVNFIAPPFQFKVPPLSTKNLVYPISWDIKPIAREYLVAPPMTAVTPNLMCHICLNLVVQKANIPPVGQSSKCH